MVEMLPMYRLTILLLIAISMLSQETTIRTTVPLVTIPVGVTDAKGNPVEGISAADFVLLDKGVPRPVKVDVLESGISPISLVAIVQTSNVTCGDRENQEDRLDDPACSGRSQWRCGIGHLRC